MISTTSVVSSAETVALFVSQFSFSFSFDDIIISLISLSLSLSTHYTHSTLGIQMERRKQEDELKQVLQQEKNLERIKVTVLNIVYSI